MERDIKTFLKYFKYDPDSVGVQRETFSNPIFYIEGNPYEGLEIKEDEPIVKNVSYKEIKQMKGQIQYLTRKIQTSTKKRKSKWD